MFRVVFAFLSLAAGVSLGARHSPVTQGALLIRHPSGAFGSECPLKHTDVKAAISGPLARVTVSQEFQNDSGEKIEAVYVFPLPHNAAVDGMTLLVGDRVVKGVVRRREEAQALYEAARNSGRAAALLDQERPNIFTQNVANILPGQRVRIEIRYVERLSWEAGAWEFVFPMVVGPRYNPATVPDERRITSPVAPPDTRAGHDLGLSVTLDAGAPLGSIASSSHQILVERTSASRAAVKLKSNAVIPNKDFVLRYEAAGKSIQDAVLTHRSEKGGFFTLMLQPPEQVTVRDTTPREIIFVLDTSGSMSGFPIEKAKEAMDLALASLHPWEKFNLITFAGETSVLFPEPVRATPANLARARAFLKERRGGGGTEMMKAIRAALEGSGSGGHIRIVCFMTDGYVGNEDEIIAEVRAHPNARVFSFGIGNAVNRYLLDKMAQAGRGDVEYVSLRDEGSAAAKRFHERVRNPLLTDISIEWNGLPVADVLPARIPDLFSARPVVVSGRYNAPARGSIRVSGNWNGKPWTREIPLELPARNPDNEVLATLWARAKVDSLAHEHGAREQITKLGLDHGLMTPFTSFVAVEETVVTEGGTARRIQVPVEIPEGVQYEGIFGPEASAQVTPILGSGFVAVRSAPARMRTVGDFAAYRPAAPGKFEPSLATRTGTLRVQIWLSDLKPATLAALRKLGVEISARLQSANALLGRLPASKLKEIAALPAIRWIAPAP